MAARSCGIVFCKREDAAAFREKFAPICEVTQFPVSKTEAPAHYRIRKHRSRRRIEILGVNFAFSYPASRARLARRVDAENFYRAIRN